MHRNLLLRLRRLVLGLVFFSVAAGAPAGAAPAQLTSVEQWVVEQVNRGELADLSGQFPEGGRKLSAHFLEGLLTGSVPGCAPQRQGINIANASVDEAIDLQNAEIGTEISLRSCHFSGNVTFTGASFSRPASFEGSTFEKDVDGNEAIASRDLLFSNATFAGSINLRGADIAGNFGADGAHFSSIAFFNGMKVGYLAVFRTAVFDGEADFGGMNVAKDFQTDEAKFTNPAQPVSLNGIKVGHSLSLTRTSFASAPNFGGADIQRDLNAQEAHFGNTQQKAVFDSIKVGHIASFDGASFAGSVSFESADIISASFFQTTFRGPAVFQRATFVDLGLVQCRGNSGPIELLDLGGSSIKRGFVLRQMHLAQLKARWLRVEGSTIFTDLVVQASADLRYSSFATLDITGTSWPTQRGSFALEGISFRSIRAAPSERGSHQLLLKLADEANYSPDVYGAMRDFFTREGFSADADRAFIAEKRRERREYLTGFRGFGSYLLDVLVGYGRHPWQALIPCAFFVCLGGCLFRPRSMEQKTPDPTPSYNRFWYSFALFLPFVHLQADEAWKPKADQPLLHHYARFHVILGWILIPIVLAALSGLIK